MGCPRAERSNLRRPNPGCGPYALRSGPGVHRSALRRVACSLLACGAACWGSSAPATSIDCQLQSLGGGTYQCTYTVTNNGSLGSASISEFDLLFDPALYAESSLTITTAGPVAGNWSEMLLASAPGVPAAYDALALGAGIGKGSSVTGFSLDFRWLGTGTPGPQEFEIYDPATFALLESGETDAGGTGPPPPPPPATGVPTPAPAVLLPFALIAVLSVRRRDARRPARTAPP